MGDEDDRPALGGEHPDHPDELLDLGRREHRGRLVEHEEPHVPEEQLEDLESLLCADREVLDDGVRFDAEVVLRGELTQAAARACAVENGERAAREAEHHVLDRGQVRDEHEVLVHHPDAVLDRRARR